MADITEQEAKFGDSDNTLLLKAATALQELAGGGGVAYPITADKGGTGVANNAASTQTITGAFGITWTVSGATALTLPTSGTLATVAGTLPITGGTLTGHLLFTDNTYDIGASGATRPRTGYFGTSLITPTMIASTTATVGAAAAPATPGVLNIVSANTAVGSAGKLILVDSADNTKRMVFGYDTSTGTQGCGWILAVKAGTLDTPIMLSPYSSVIIGGVAVPTTTLDVRGSIRTGSCTVATLGSAATLGAGAQRWVTDAAGSPCMAISDGTNWKRCDDMSVTVT